MPTTARNRKAWIVAAIVGLALLCGVIVLLFQSILFRGNEVVDDHGNVVGYEYRAKPSVHADLYREAARLIVERDNAGAEKIYLQLVHLEPNRPDAYIGLAGAQLSQFYLDQARKNYAAAIQLDQKNAEALCGAGLVEYTEGKHQKAREYFQKSLSEAPDHLLSHYAMAKVCHELGETLTAKRYAKRFLELSPDSALKQEMLNIFNAPDS